MNEALLKRINELCEERNISKRKLQESIGIGTGSISKWNKSNPSLDTLEKMAAYFCVSIDYLTGKSQFRDQEHMFQILDQKYEEFLRNSDNIPADGMNSKFSELAEYNISYVDPETREIANAIKQNKNLKLLFEASKNASADELKLCCELLNRMKKEEASD